jgi:hypothetical protein
VIFKLLIFSQLTATQTGKKDHNIGFTRKPPIFDGKNWRKLAEIAENSDHNIDPLSVGLPCYDPYPLIFLAKLEFELITRHQSCATPFQRHADKSFSLGVTFCSAERVRRNFTSFWFARPIYKCKTTAPIYCI